LIAIQSIGKQAVIVWFKTKELFNATRTGNHQRNDVAAASRKEAVCHTKADSTGKGRGDDATTKPRTVGWGADLITACTIKSTAIA
jgi:hypothetical protein